MESLKLQRIDLLSVELNGLKLDEGKRVMEIMQQVWESDSWLH